MRTTLELPEPLFTRARELARVRGVSFGELVAEALLRLMPTEARAKPFKVADTTFGGDGLVDGLHDLSWARIGRLAYSEEATHRDEIQPIAKGF